MSLLEFMQRPAASGKGGAPLIVSGSGADVVEGDLALRGESRIAEGYPAERALRDSCNGGVDWHALGLVLDADAATLSSGKILVST